MIRFNMDYKFEIHYTLLDGTIIIRIGTFEKIPIVTDSFVTETIPSIRQLFIINKINDGIIFCIENEIKNDSYIKHLNHEDFTFLTTLEYYSNKYNPSQ